MLAFDQPMLTERLNRMSPTCRTLFALCCAERLFPLYGLYANSGREGDLGLLRSTLDHLWESASERKTSGTQAFLDKYESLIPGEDAHWTPLNPLAENAVAAVVYACRTKTTGKTEDAAWAAVQSYEAVDYMAHTLQGIKFGGPQAEATILKTECVQAELGRQLRDLAKLEGAPRAQAAMAELMAELRDRAKLEGGDLVPRAAELLQQAKKKRRRKGQY